MISVLPLGRRWALRTEGASLLREFLVILIDPAPARGQPAFANPAFVPSSRPGRRACPWETPFADAEARAAEACQISFRIHSPAV
jgi:hypothetical protein